MIIERLFYFRYMKCFQNQYRGTNSTGTKRCFAKSRFAQWFNRFRIEWLLRFSQSGIFGHGRVFKIILKVATGSRFLSGDRKLHQEKKILLISIKRKQRYFSIRVAMLLLQLLSSRRKFDFIRWICSTSIRDGVQLSNATACKFNHNDFEDLERLIQTQD
jgi:hypothetical protein